MLRLHLYRGSELTVEEGVYGFYGVYRFSRSQVGWKRKKAYPLAQRGRSRMGPGTLADGLKGSIGCALSPSLKGTTVRTCDIWARLGTNDSNMPDTWSIRMSAGSTPPKQHMLNPKYRVPSHMHDVQGR